MAGAYRLNKKQIAEVRVLADMGNSMNSIAKEIGVDNKTIKAYLTKYDVMNDKEVQEMVNIIKEKELNDLHVIAGKGRAVLNGYLDSVLSKEKEPNPIAVMAIVDRIFQQRRLLEGQSTHNVSVFSTIVQNSTSNIIRKPIVGITSDSNKPATE